MTLQQSDILNQGLELLGPHALASIGYNLPPGMKSVSCVLPYQS
jgi:hypothetical protein